MRNSTTVWAIATPPARWISPSPPGDTVVGASLTVSLRGINGAESDNDRIWLDGTSNPQSFTSLGWTLISIPGSSMRRMEIPPALLADG